MNNNTRLIYLLKQYADDIASNAERAELEMLILADGAEETKIAALSEIFDETAPATEHSEERLQAIWNTIRQTDTNMQSNQSTPRLRSLPNRRVWWAAAALVVVLGSLAYFLYKPEPAANSIAKENKLAPANDLLPGGNKAVLTLSDGSTIILDSAKNGTLAQQGSSEVSKLNNGQLAYNVTPENTATVLYNTLSTPAGGQYQLVLPDGSTVWLNAASSITYPTAFTGTERNVTITGEVYFEVARNEQLPFKVKAGELQVEVLGTHFNINAYADEPISKTTLLEGSVRLTANDIIKTLGPGQQGQLLPTGGLELVSNVDTETAIAWKNGLFRFENADIKTVMRQIARWYNVEVEYRGALAKEKFVGEIPRNSNVSDVFKILELSNVHFKIEGNKIIVLP